MAVAVTEVRLLSNSNKSKYVLHGEGATLTCHFVLETYESVSEVEWEKDGVLVYYWSMNKPPIARDVLEGRVDLSVTSPMILSITKAHMDLQGTYTCRVRTNGRTAQNDIFLMVIVDACHEDAWKTHSDMTTCTETVNMHCVGMYPKPSPACGVYNELTGKFLNSVPFDSVNTLFNGTYEVSFNRRFTIDDWINHTDISFRCHMLVLGTTWRSGIKHQLFGDPGCKEPPPGVTNGYYNLTDEKSCWELPGEGAMAEYFCNSGYELNGASVFTCRSGKWTLDEGVIADEKLPFCNVSGALSYIPIFYVVVASLSASLGFWNC